MRGLILMFGCLLMLAANAQDSTATVRKPRFFSTNQAVHLEGSSGSAFGVQTVNGVHYKGWGLALGAGLDLYRMRSYPIFVHLRRQAPFTRVPLFMYGDFGKNYVWARKGETLLGNNTQIENGNYWDAGLQYHARLRTKTVLVFSAGYGQKTYSESFSYSVWCVTGNCPEVKSVFDYAYRRILLKAGFQF